MTAAYASARFLKGLRAEWQSQTKMRYRGINEREYHPCDCCSSHNSLCSFFHRAHHCEGRGWHCPPAAAQYDGSRGESQDRPMAKHSPYALAARNDCCSRGAYLSTDMR